MSALVPAVFKLWRINTCESLTCIFTIWNCTLENWKLDQKRCYKNLYRVKNSRTKFARKIRKFLFSCKNNFAKRISREKRETILRKISFRQTKKAKLFFFEQILKKLESRQKNNFMKRFPHFARYPRKILKRFVKLNI